MLESHLESWCSLLWCLEQKVLWMLSSFWWIQTNKTADTAFVLLLIQNPAPWPLTRSTLCSIAELLTVISAHLSGMMKNGDNKDSEKLFERVQMQAAGTVRQISNCNSSFEHLWNANKQEVCPWKHEQMDKPSIFFRSLSKANPD